MPRLPRCTRPKLCGDLGIYLVPGSLITKKLFSNSEVLITGSTYRQIEDVRNCVQKLLRFTSA